MKKTRLSHLKPDDRKAVEAFVEALRRECDGDVLLLALIGSKARGDDTPDSDIDFLVVTETEPAEFENRIRKAKIAVEMEYNTALNSLVFDRARWADFARRRAAFWRNAQSDGILLLRSQRLPESLVMPAPDEEKYMADNSSEIKGYVQQAQQAVKTAEAEFEKAEDYRVVANRAYYAIFYSANAMLATLGLQRAKHSGVMGTFREKFVKTGEIEDSFSVDYGVAMEHREKADYDMDAVVDKPFARAALEAAQRFVPRIEQYLKERGFLTE